MEVCREKCLQLKSKLKNSCGKVSSILLTWFTLPTWQLRQAKRKKLPSNLIMLQN